MPKFEIFKTLTNLSRCNTKIATKKNKLEIILLELRELEQNLLFKNVLHIQPLKTRHAILNEFETTYRVKAEQDVNIPITNKTEEKIVQNLISEKEHAQRIGFVNHLLPEIIVNNIPRSEIINIVNNDQDIPNNLKRGVIEDILESTNK